jgi:hypothetical protein
LPEGVDGADTLERLDDRDDDAQVYSPGRPAPISEPESAANLIAGLRD